ncbi:hypothetical protein MTP09_11550 [Chryseobacterium suipulveris]|uniref:Lipoprotein n=1 Tax=Chryseobacterium suipulveris TaxID=2929800 RepID=A0ABY4BMY1_9FLAO|nr:hypothetical protein [Chryseobacterium suipulveris]UOE40535.1 hypothetical protein MTP09_11550 [Chryseobacterium suipulveris]
MKKTALFLVCIALLSCKKNSESTLTNKVDSTKIIESINVVRTKYNDSIRILNQKNIFGDLSGSRTLKFSSDEAALSGKINFNKTGRDEYDVNGKAVSGKNKISVIGSIRRVSDKHLNFEGRVAQMINGKKYVRTERTTFLNEGKGKFWRLQDKVNSEGFIEYIDIY